MAVFYGCTPLPLHSTPLYSLRPPRKARMSCSSSSQMDPQNEIGGKKFIDFPYVSVPQRTLMVELVSILETRLNPYLNPCTLPPDVQFYQNQTGSAQASLYIRSGLNSSPGSWIHCELPSGGALNITSLSAYLNASTDAPNYVLEFIQSSPTSSILILDLPPRKDLVLHPEYLKTFYEDTQLDKHRQLLENIPGVRPYVSPSLYIRSFFSPTVILICIDTEAGGQESMEEMVRDHVSPIAKEMLGVWLDQCACRERAVEDSERLILVKRDQVIKKQTVEIDLGSSMPRLFGSDVAARVLGAIREVYNV